MISYSGARARTAGAILATGTALVIALGGAASPAAATPVDVLVSTDGVHFTSALGSELFDGTGHLIPGGSARSTLWIKNPSDAPAAVRVSARDGGLASVDLAEYLTLSAWNSYSRTTTSIPSYEDAECGILVPSRQMEAGAIMKLVVTVSLADLTGVTGQNERTELGLMVAMRDAQAGAFPASACDDDGVLISSAARLPAALPRTGFDLPLPLVIGSGFFMGVGILLASKYRRNGSEKP